MWFNIEYNNKVVGTSNFVYFNEADSGRKTLEWGVGGDFGLVSNWDDGEFTITAHLERYSNFPDKNAIPIDSVSRTGSNNIKIYKFSDDDILNNLYLEFDQQTNQDLWGYFIEKNVKEAFNPAFIRFNFQLDDQNLIENYVLIMGDAIRQFISQNKDYSTWNYICSIKGFKDENNDVIYNVRGKSTLPQNVDDDELGSLIAFETTFNSETPPYYKAVARENFFEKVLTKALIHELGHQLGLTSDAHTQNHDSFYCVMYQGSYGSDKTTSTPYRSLYENPHFCKYHLSQLLNY